MTWRVVFCYLKGMNIWSLRTIGPLLTVGTLVLVTACKENAPPLIRATAATQELPSEVVDPISPAIEILPNSLTNVFDFQQNQELDSNEPATPVLIILGGFNSCKRTPEANHMALKSDELILRFQNEIAKNWKVAPILVRGCFRNSVRDGSEYYYDGFSDQVMSLNITTFFGNHTKTESTFQLLAQAIAASARSKSKRVKNPVFFLAGHSMGAWIAQKSAQILVNKGEDVRGLLTVDPINALECSPLDYLSHAGKPVPGCTRSPQEWNSAAARAFDENIGYRWFNFFQTQFYFLHSGPVDILGDRNFERYYDDPIQHTAMDGDTSIWDAYAAQITEALMSSEAKK